jgi:hypothetical protein
MIARRRARLVRKAGLIPTAENKTLIKDTFGTSVVPFFCGCRLRCEASRASRHAPGFRPLQSDGNRPTRSWGDDPTVVETVTGSNGIERQVTCNPKFTLSFSKELS